MLLDIVKKGSTDRSVIVRIIDATDGTPETGVVYNTSGIDLWYRREGAAVSSITEATLAALTTAHTDGGFLHVSHGYYRLDLPDAAFATGANYVDVGGTVTGMVVIGGRVRLVDFDPEDSVRAGLTALPNAAADAAGGLPISDAGGLDLDALDSNVTTLIGRITSTLFAGITSLAEWLGLMAGKQAGDATARTELRGTGAGSGTYDETTDSLEAIKDAGGGGPTAADVADAVWDEAKAGHVAAGSFGEEVQAHALTSEVSAVDGKVDTAQADLDLLTGADGATLATSQPNYAPATASALATHDGKLDIVDANVDTLLTRITSTLFNGITSLAEWLGAAFGKQAPDATAQTEIRATGAGSGTFDPTTDSLEAVRDTEPLGTAMRGTDSGALASVCTEARLAELDAGNLPADVAANLAAIAAQNDPTAAAIATAILDADATAHTTNSTLGAIINDLEDAGRLDALVDAIKVITDAIGATAAANLAKALGAAGCISGTVDTVTNTHTPTTTEFQADDILEATTDHYKGRIVIFTSGALLGQATDITGYSAVGGIGQLTVTAMTEAPANDDTFIIV